MHPDLESRKLDDLNLSFRKQVDLLLAACRTRGVEMRPFFTVRGPAIQAKLWCQSRTRAQIVLESKRLHDAGAPWLASLLDPTKALKGPKVTNALPGASWHQWGEAVDCFVAGAKSEAIWNTKHPGYRVYAEEAVRLGLEAGANWKSLPDTVHVQSLAAASPLAAGKSWSDVEAAMIRLYKAAPSTSP